MSEPEDTKPEKADIVIGTLSLIFGWHAVFHILDFVFIKKTSSVSQPFFIALSIITILFIVIGFLFVCKYYFPFWKGWQ